MFISREPFWSWASSVYYDAPVKKGSQDITFPMNGIHRTYRCWVDNLAYGLIFMRAVFPFVAKEAKN